MIALTGGGSFADAYQAIDNAEIVSSRELTDDAFIAKLAQADVIIHNASSLNLPDVASAVEKNFDYTKRLIDILQSTNPNAHLLFLSSMSILANNDASSYDDVLNMSPYAYSKYLAETYCLKSALRNVSCIRFSTLFYKDFQKDGLSSLINDAASTGKISLINDGEAARDFLPLDVAVQYVKEIVNRQPVGHQVYTLASGETKTFAQIAEILSRQLPGLEVNNLQQDSLQPVLSTFPTHDIDALGRIPFSLEAKIIDYISSLKS